MLHHGVNGLFKIQRRGLCRPGHFCFTIVCQAPQKGQCQAAWVESGCFSLCSFRKLHWQRAPNLEEKHGMVPVFIGGGG